jgi:hypothetical protein
MIGFVSDLLTGVLLLLLLLAGGLFAPMNFGYHLVHLSSFLVLLSCVIVSGMALLDPTTG